MWCIIILFIVIIITPVRIPAAELHLEKEFLVNENPVKTDTISRFYRYNSNGILSAVIDSPRINQFHNPTYDAHCDGIGRVIEVNSCRNAPDLPELTPKVSTRYYWFADNRVAFASRDTDNVLLDTGAIQAWGKIRIVRLPQIEPFPTEKEMQLIIVVSDSTGLFDKDGNRRNTYYWQFDSLGNDTVWHYRTPEGKKVKIQSYTNVYYPDGRLKRRFPAMEGTISHYFYALPAHAFSINREANGRHAVTTKAGVSHFYRKAFLLNGRLLPSSGRGIDGKLQLTKTGANRFFLFKKVTSKM
jgi:hypothetical protein